MPPGFGTHLVVELIFVHDFAHFLLLVEAIGPMVLGALVVKSVPNQPLSDSMDYRFGCLRPGEPAQSWTERWPNTPREYSDQYETPRTFCEQLMSSDPIG